MASPGAGTAAAGSPSGLWPSAGLLLMALALWVGVLAPWRPLALPDEGRYVGVALEMLRSGDWLVPTLDGLPYFHKPPLFYWITAAALGLGGPQVLAARAAPLLAAVAMAALLGAFAARWLGREVAAWALAALATMPFFVGAAQFANLDLVVAACITGAIVGLADGLLRDRDDPAAARTIAGGWAMAGLGVLAKGLIGLVLPVAVVALWSLLRRRTLRGMLADARRALFGAGPPLAAAIALPWFVAVELRHPGFIDYFIIEQHLRRYAAAGFNNPMPFWFYLPVITGLTLPWVAFLGRGPAARAPGDAAAAVRSLSLAWIVVVVLFFSVPRSKLVGYVLPVLPPLALLLADRACTEPRAWLHDRRRRIAVLLLGAGLSVALMAAAALLVQGRSHADVAALLDREAPAGEPLFALDRQPYDLAFHARVPRPLLLVADWQDPALLRRDDWRKELLDAARFDRARAALVLLDRAEARRRWCSRPASWVLAAADVAAAEPALATAVPRLLSATTGLWRLDLPRLQAARLCP